jgi:glycosyltransferase involved in cell wall biosynthesis
MTDLELLRDSDLFDVDWYERVHPEVRRLDVSAEEHYLRVGALLGYDPGPDFSTSCYLVDSPDVASAHANPLIHYLRIGRSEGRIIRRAGQDPKRPDVEMYMAPPSAAPRRTYPGQLPRRAGRSLVLVVGHLAGTSLFGAERSLLGLLESLHSIDFDVGVVLPSDQNPDYVGAVRARSSVVHIMPVPARQPRLEPEADVVEQYRRLVIETGAAAVHANTIVPREALIAAREVGIPAVIHVREIAVGDPELESWLGASAEEIVTSVLDDADYVIATSRAVADAHPLSGRTAVVPNTIDPELFSLSVESSERAVRVALIGSVHPKKGVREFVEVARLLRSRPDASFLVVGPTSPLVHQLTTEGLPSNVRFTGAAEDPMHALAGVDIVVSLSTVSEAFGRTVLEAMAAARPVVVVARGGLPELVRDGVCGFLVPADDVTLFAHRVAQLIDDVGLRRRMGDAGRRIARDEYSAESSAVKLANAYRAILPGVESQRQRAHDVHVPLPMDNRSEFEHPFYIQNRARFAFCTSVAFAAPDRLVCASLLGRELHVIRFDRAARVADIVSTLPTTDGEEHLSVDLLDHDGNDRLVTSNCEHSTLSIYRLVEDGVEFVDVVRPFDDGSYCHGAAFAPGRPDVVCAATITGSCELTVLSLTDGHRLASFAQPGWVVKDVAFGTNGSLVTALMGEPVGRDSNARHLSKLVLLSAGDDLAEFTILDQIELPDVTVDGCCVHGGLVLAASQSEDAILVFQLDDDRLERLPDLLGFSFPHDVAISPDGEWIAVANYGTNDVQLRPMPESLVHHVSSPS